MPILRNARHERFAQGLAEGKCADEAYQAAGYKPDRGHASRLATNGSIVARVAEIQAIAVEKVGLTKEWVIERLIENANRAMQGVQVLDKDGKPTGEWKYDGAVANRALELLGKEQGMFVDRTVNENVEHVVGRHPSAVEDWTEKHNATSH
jgi:phage terminase small subunit